jgi:murein DD-endopeptidase MepM/ murein hydrolase activator NlpD
MRRRTTIGAQWEIGTRGLLAAAGLALILAWASPAAETKDCGGGAKLRLTAPETSQGSLVLVELKGAAPLNEVNGEWDGKNVPFWKEAASGEVRKALLGVDLEKPAGPYEIKVSGEAGGGEKISCSATVAVKNGAFATEKLQVQKQFVEPDPAQLERANNERKRLREIYDTVTPERLWTGNFRLPLDGITTGKNFGTRRVLNGHPGSPHGGVDYPAPTGTPIHATQRGRVALAEELFFSGNTVVLDHGLGIYTFYGHMSKIDVKPGDLVEVGAVLGEVGATGRVTGPHLHWGLSVERARVNPRDLLTVLGNEQGVRRQRSSTRKRLAKR